MGGNPLAKLSGGETVEKMMPGTSFRHGAMLRRQTSCPAAAYHASPHARPAPEPRRWVVPWAVRCSQFQSSPAADREPTGGRDSKSLPRRHSRVGPPLAAPCDHGCVNAALRRGTGVGWTALPLGRGAGVSLHLDAVHRPAGATRRETDTHHERSAVR